MSETAVFFFQNKWATHSCAGVAEFMEQGSKKHEALQEKTAREQIWTSHRNFQGWTCSQCEWNYPLPTMLSDADARTAYDRLATGKFREHKCADHLARLSTVDNESFTPRIRKLVSQHGERRVARSCGGSERIRA